MKRDKFMSIISELTLDKLQEMEISNFNVSGLDKNNLEEMSYILDITDFNGNKLTEEQLLERINPNWKIQRRKQKLNSIWKK